MQAGRTYYRQANSWYARSICPKSNYSAPKDAGRVL